MKNGLMQPTELPQHSNSTHNSILERDEKSDGEGIGLLAVFISDLFIIFHSMNYTEIEMEWMKEILRDKEEEIKKLNEKIRFLEECLDNKEKVNKSLREELENLKAKDYAKQCWD